MAECAHCEQPVGEAPVQFADEVAWLGERKARSFCSLACMDAYAEHQYDLAHP